MFSRFFISFFFMNPHFSLPICFYISPKNTTRCYHQFWSIIFHVLRKNHGILT